MNRGFVLIELMIAVFIITGALMAANSINHRVTSDTHLMSDRFTAAYLAQEGMEIVRAIRKTNWKEGNCWYQGIDEGVYEGDYQSTSLNSLSGDLSYLRKDEFYNYTSGQDTQFRRVIEIEKKEVVGLNMTDPDLQDEYLDIKTTIFWDYKGREYSLEVREDLYNWAARGPCP